MSWRHVEAAIRLRLARPPTKAVLLVLAHRAHADNGVCWPSLEHLQLGTGLSRRSVQNALSELEAAKLVALKRGVGKRTTVYTLTLPDCPPLEVGQKAPEVHELHLRGAGGAPGGAGGAPRIVKEDTEKDARAVRRPLAEDWRPDPGCWERLAHDFAELDLAAELAQFRDKSIAAGETYADPVAAFRSWLRHGQRFAERDKRKARDVQSGRGSLDALRARAAAERAG